MSQGWAAQELSGIDLGDARLNKRSVILLDRQADKPTASIPNACNGWAQTQAAYRFLAQEEIGWEDISAPHFACTHERMQNRPVVLCLQDTTELDFNGQEIGGLGTLSYAAQRGMYLHPIYAVSPEREPPGVLDAWMWVRDATKKASRSLAAGAKESCRWVEGYQRLAEQAPSLPATQLVYVADRKGDFIELLAKASALGTPVDWLIRSCQNRLVVGEQDKLWEGLDDAHLLGEIRFTLTVFDREEWQAAYIVARKPIPPEPPSLNTVIA